MKLRDKTAIITGGAQGLGASIAEVFSQEGANVVIADVQVELGHSIEKAVKTMGGDALFVSTDVTDEQSWENLINTSRDAYGRIDILVNNAGISGHSETDHNSTAGWNRLMATNITGTYFGCKYVIPELLKNGGGAIVNISSIMGLVGGEEGHPAYGASKGAVRSLTKTLAVRYGERGIRINSIHPGFLAPMKGVGALADTNIRKRNIDITPLQRFGDYIEVAKAVLFLASDDASFITGVELPVDGGFTGI